MPLVVVLLVVTEECIACMELYLFSYIDRGQSDVAHVCILSTVEDLTDCCDNLYSLSARYCTIQLYNCDGI